ncbi:YcdB/YcdC domain-containing protein [Thermanaeromonas sp. C210]|uniref:YcdB/YcdC domain-containing protein n=1 Tax=Thermanaeromonas sp. C210 TaxID=2731925 RepID=UPI00155C4B17|nr:YcdB/YcdC domain-containing protein [Thermanaeromonas sp. C210]GFN22211.1 peptidase M4 [Thermanaeromonas sp. C210]
MGKPDRGLIKGTLLAAAFLWTCLALLPGTARAEVQPAVTLEQAIEKVKAVFEVPGDFTQFSSSYQQDEEGQSWHLTWQRAQEPGGTMNAAVDAQTGEILSMYLWRHRPETGAQLPSLSRQEALKTAEELLRRLHPSRLEELSLQAGEEELLPLWARQQSAYSFRWQRLVNGIPFPADGVSISVDAQTGQVTSYNLRWTRAEFPDATKAISPERARQAFDQAGMLKLQYFRPYPTEPKKKMPVMLVYRLDHPSGGAIDALTGEPVDLDGGWMGSPGGDGMGAYDRAAKQALEQPSTPLTPEEIREIQETTRLISQQEAEAVVRQWVSIPQDCKLDNAALTADTWTDPPLRTWNFSWSTQQDGDNYRYVHARVNAVTGELLSFHIGPSPGESEKEARKLTRKEAQAKAEAFLQKIQPERFRQVELVEDRYLGPIRPLEEELPAYHVFYYRRLVNDVPYPEDGFSITVDAATGDITSYNLAWSDLDFPRAEGILSAGEAVERYLSRQPLTLSYVEIYRPRGDREIKLVYRPTVLPGAVGAAMIEAKTGEALDWQGKPVAQQPRPYRFTDIAGHWAEKEISLLGQAGLFGEYGNTFRPQERIKAAQLLRAMIGAQDGVPATAGLSDEQVLDRARLRGWVKENLAPGDEVSRQMLARLMVRFLGLDRAARARDIYRVPFADAGEIPSDSLGYVALSYGLDILQGDGRLFRPEEPVSRAEAAVALARTLNMEK